MKAARAPFAALLVFVLAGFGSCQPRPTAPVADANAECYRPCTPSLTDTGVRWQGDAEDPAAWDDLATDTLKTLRTKLLTCESRRQECAGFIQDLKDRGVIRGK